MLTLTEHVHPDHLHLELRGRLDSGGAPAFVQHVEQKIDPSARVILDLSAVDYVSSAGLRGCLLLAKKLQRGGGKLVVCGMAASVFEVFRIAGLNKLLNIESDLVAARARLG